MRVRIWIVTLVLAAGVFAGFAGAALLAWPQARLAGDDVSLARVVLPGFAGRVAVIRVRAAGGTRVSVELRQGRIWPLRKLAAGERLTVMLTVRRPGWVAWPVGRSERRSFQVETPTARLLGRWLQVRPGAQVRIGFDASVRLVSLGSAGVRRLASPRAVVSAGVVARGSHSAGAIEVAAAARSCVGMVAPETSSPAAPGRGAPSSCARARRADHPDLLAAGAGRAR